MFSSKHLRAVKLLSLWGLSFWAEEEEGAALRCQELAWGPEEKCHIGCYLTLPINFDENPITRCVEELTNRDLCHIHTMCHFILGNMGL